MVLNIHGLVALSSARSVLEWTATIQSEKGGVRVAIVQKSSTLIHICTRLVIPNGKCDLKSRRPFIIACCLRHHLVARGSWLVNDCAERTATEVPFGVCVKVCADYPMTRWWRWDKFPHCTNSTILFPRISQIMIHGVAMLIAQLSRFCQDEEKG